MNTLKHIEEFQKILSDYHISDASKQLLKHTKIVLMLAPTSGGRNTIIKELLKTGAYYYIVSDTTRKQRINNGVPEQNGVEYWFRSEEEVLQDLKAGKFLEAEIIHNQQVSGISMRELEHANKEKKIAITDIELLGLENILKAKPDTVAILVLPPSFDEWVRRINSRGKMPEQELRQRMETAIRIFETGIQKDYSFVINDSFEHAVEQVHHLARLGRTDPKMQVEGRKLAEELCKATRKFLKG